MIKCIVRVINDEVLKDIKKNRTLFNMKTRFLIENLKHV